MATFSAVSKALDSMFERPDGLYGDFNAIPVISQHGHRRRVALLEGLDIGNVENATVVDFGMGNWGFAAVYPRLHDCAQPIGMDISEYAIEVSNKRVAESNLKNKNRFKAYQSDGMTLPLPDNSVDIFFSGESIEHVSFPLRYLCEVYRVLKPNGQLIVTTPNRDAILYRQKGEEYCTSPEHFWLFNYDELVDTLSYYFEIREAYGFNGSYGSVEEDREDKDEKRADWWSGLFRNEPSMATGVVLRTTKKPNVKLKFEINPIPESQIRIEGIDRRLPLEFGLEGSLLDKPTSKITITRPAGHGMVCRFWAHRWSGFAGVSKSGEHPWEVDLYAHNPGWKQWVDDRETSRNEAVTITSLFKKNDRSIAPEVLFYEAFLWTVKNGPAVKVPGSFTKKRQPLFQKGYGLERFKPFVTTTVFHWFGPTEGNVRGPWPPIGGRQGWDGSKQFWLQQIKQIMFANIDVIYMHLIEQFEEHRIEFFKAYAELRALGWDVPKVAPFLDPNIIWQGKPIDGASPAGKDAFANQFIRFFRQYFEHNADPQAVDYLACVDGKLALSTWWVVHHVRNLDQLSREDVRVRLAAALGTQIPNLANGIYMTTTAAIDPDLTFADERAHMFGGYAYAIHSVHDSVDVWHVQAGYWDQNIRKPGYLLPRDGGKNYKRAWEAAIAGDAHRVYVESWNEYDEGSGIYPADPHGMFVDQAMHGNTDRFSDTDDPFEYVRTTHAGASRLNRRADYAASFLNVRTVNKTDKQVEYEVVVRNDGNAIWHEADGLKLRLTERNEVHGEVHLAHFAYDTTVTPEKGIVRGQVALAYVGGVVTNPAALRLVMLIGDCEIGSFMGQL